MKNKVKVILSILLVAVMALSFTACELELDVSSIPSTEDSSSQDESVLSSSNPSSTEKKPSKNENKVKISVNTTKQTSKNWKMTYKNCEIKNKLDSFTKASDGTEYVLVFFELENKSNENQSFNIFGSDFYVDGVKTPQTIYGLLINGSYQLTSSQVEAGRKVNGYFLFQVSKSWKNLEIIYNEDLLKQDNTNVLKFTITKSE